MSTLVTRPGAHRLAVLAAAVLALTGPPARWALADAAGPTNLAPAATVSASSEYSPDFAARFAVDGIVPDPLCRQPTGDAWCIRRDQVGDQGTFTLEWPEPVQVAEIVYFGRTAQLLSECWKDYEVYLDDVREPAARGTFRMLHGPQRIPLPACRVHKITLRFLNSHGPHNPGASEIAVYGEPPSDEQLEAFCPGEELRARFARGELGFRELLLFRRHPLNLSHAYVYHAEGFLPGGGLYAYQPSAKGSRRSSRPLKA